LIDLYQRSNVGGKLTAVKRIECVQKYKVAYTEIANHISNCIKDNLIILFGQCGVQRSIRKEVDGYGKPGRDHRKISGKAFGLTVCITSPYERLQPVLYLGSLKLK